MEFDIKKHTIYRCIHGSRAYGTHTPLSDYDYKGIAIAPLEYYLGFSKRFEQSEKYVSKGQDIDEVIYDIQKFFKLAADCNPNIIEVIFCDENEVLFCDKFGKMILDIREKFISKRAKFTFTGYAVSQLKRIRGHRSWLLNPPKKKPERSDFGLPIDSKMSSSEMGAYEHVSKTEKLPEHIMSLLQKEKQYANSKKEWDQYQNWKENRNKERAKDEARFGFDSKHAYHLIRLLRMGEEILQGKGVLVKRLDADELLEIRNGAMTYEEIVDMAESRISNIDDLYDKSSIPKTPDVNFLSKKCMEIIKEYHNI